MWQFHVGCPTWDMPIGLLIGNLFLETCVVEVRPRNMFENQYCLVLWE